MTPQELKDKLGDAMYVISRFEKLLQNRSVYDLTELEQEADTALDDFRRWWGDGDEQ